MAWIESHQELGAHPKTRKLARVLGISRPTAVGHLQFLWWWAMDYAEDGELARFDALDVAVGGEWEGESDVFVDALVDAGFLVRHDNMLSINDWHDYAGKLIERRKADAERKRAGRRKDEPPVPTPVPVASVGRPADGVRTAYVTQPYPTVPNPTEPDPPPVAPQAAEPADAGGRGSSLGPVKTADEPDPSASRSKPTAVVASTPSPPSSGSPPTPPPPIALVEAWAGAAGVELRDLGETGRKKQFAVAKRLAGDGLTAADVTAMVGWLATQDWRQGGIDMLVIEQNRVRWVAAGKPSRTQRLPAATARGRPREKPGYDRNQLIAIGRGESP